jgi:excisionase family DNA binding protein
MSQELFEMNKIQKELQKAAQMVLAASQADQQVELLTMKRACEITQLSRWTISKLIKRGLIRAVKLGSAKSSPVRIYEDSLRSYLTSIEVNFDDRKEVTV